MKRFYRVVLICSGVLLLWCTLGAANATAQYLLDDPLDPNDRLGKEEPLQEDEEKSAEQLIREAELLFIEERLLDARTKLLLALKKDPENYQTYSLLSGYYLVHVGHFKLALRYIRKAQEYFEKAYGPPPYLDALLKSTHAHHLHILSQARLNLDDYAGALRVLDEYESYGYYQDWYPGSRAWILMKNGELSEAIQVSRVGIMNGAEPGRTLNILGILLSMTGERQSSLQIFDQAIAHEFSLGTYGQPATPLNNSGEVYRETFQEEDAERSWMRATSLPDGCEHVLPALNLATIRMERLDYRGAKQALDNFESCVAQFPLRNGEEHRALVHLARGRIDLHTGFLEQAIEHLRAALKRQQWFGKIGTDVEDLQVGVLASLSFALKSKASRDTLRPLPGLSLPERIARWTEGLSHQIESWWLKRRMIQTLIDHLGYGEDLYIRNTDSMIEYATLGAVLRQVPQKTLMRRVALEDREDDRGPAHLFYESYRAERMLDSSQRREGIAKLQEIQQRLRLPADGALKVHVLLTLAKELREDSREYRQAATEAFLLNRASLPNYGIRLPVNISSSENVGKEDFALSPFLVTTAQERDFVVSHTEQDGLHQLRFRSRTGRAPIFTVKGDRFDEVLLQLVDEVFRVPLNG
ncbi:hypothetical protein MRY87_08475 [bacterium]|nr:hypothetical protein [bacterium]